MTDITELAQSLKAAAVRAKTATEEYASGHMSVSVCFAECEEFNRLTDGPDNILALVEALEGRNALVALQKIEIRELNAELEKAQQRIADMESTRDDIPFGFDESGNNELAAFKLALAAMDSEPVIADCDPEVYEKGVSACLVVIPKETAEVICKGISAATGCKVDWHYIGGRVHIKALQAAPQPAPVVDSEPATVPGRWIPVSERMPEAGGDMIVFTDGIVMSGVSYAKKKGFYIQALEYDDDEPVDGVTHWMSLPAAPQESINALIPLVSRNEQEVK